MLNFFYIFWTSRTAFEVLAVYAFCIVKLLILNLFTTCVEKVFGKTCLSVGNYDGVVIEKVVIFLAVQHTEL